MESWASRLSDGSAFAGMACGPSTWSCGRRQDWAEGESEPWCCGNRGSSSRQGELPLGWPSELKLKVVFCHLVSQSLNKDCLEGETTTWQGSSLSKDRSRRGSSPQLGNEHPGPEGKSRWHTTVSTTARRASRTCRMDKNKINFSQVSYHFLWGLGPTDWVEPSPWQTGSCVLPLKAQLWPHAASPWVLYYSPAPFLLPGPCKQPAWNSLSPSSCLALFLLVTFKFSWEDQTVEYQRASSHKEMENP
jgi:hypothetical protein